MKLSGFWSDHLWLPGNTTWADLEEKDGIVYAQPKAFWIQVPLVLVLLTLRFLSERYIFKPLGVYLKISNYRRKAPPNPELEIAYMEGQFFKNNVQKINFPSDRESQRWLRLRMNQDKPTSMYKFSECMWKGCQYLINTSYGLYVLWNHGWAWNPKMYFEGYPFQGISPELHRYYMLSTSFYLSLTITLFRDVRRKDFTEMAIHHIITISLFYLTWGSQCFRIGCVAAVLHDLGDVFLELGKAAKYAKFERLVNCVFVVFVTVWVVTRILFMPVFVYPSGVNQTMKTPVPVLLIMMIIFIIALILTVIWTRLIFISVHKALKDGQVKKDVRSSQSEDEE